MGHASIPFNRDTVPLMGGEVAAPPNADATQDGAPLFKIASNDGQSSALASFQTIPRDSMVMLRISPQSAGGSFGYILLDPSKRIHQDALLAHVLPCPNVNNFPTIKLPSSL
jgi:hypothetical protein